MSGCQDLHSCTYIMTLKFMLTKSAQPLLPRTRGGCSSAALLFSSARILSDVNRIKRSITHFLP